MKRVSSGVPGFDALVEGGFPQGASILVSGGPGTGKSIFCLEYLYHGAKDYGEPGLYATLEEGPHNLWWNMQRFKWDLIPLEREGKLKILKFDPDPGAKLHLNQQMERIIEKARDMKAKRLVIDSITAFSFWAEDLPRIRAAIYNLIENLRKINCTTLLTCETKGRKSDLSRFGVEEFLSDGVLQLFFMPPHRALFVRKMRGTDHSSKVHPIVMNNEGLSVNSKEELLWESIKD
ncbi:MAG: RAD55 family ATPase [Candidatus Micrarchaeia archaeon]